MKNILLTIAYDGTLFSGWQIQPSERTVQREIQKALTELCGTNIQIAGTSRTDAGVHALGQRATFQGEFGIPTDRIKIALNGLLPEDIKIEKAEEVPIGFHARFDSCGKKYVYRITNSPEKEVFRRNYSYNIEKKLDVGVIRQAASYFIGTHDFKAFMAAGGKPMESTVRTIYEIEIEEQFLSDSSKEIIISFKGNGFLYNMIRIITGTLVQVGTGKISATSIPEIILSKKREKAGFTAPPQGLYLAEVYFKGSQLIGR